MRTLIRSRRALLALVALALAGTGFTAYGAVAGEETAYRTAVVSTGDVDQELALSGVVQPSGQSDIAFGTSGTVANVRVAQGDEVAKGQVVATLDRAALRAGRDRAQADLAEARAQLVADRAAQTTSVAATATSTTSTPSTSDSASGPKSTVPTGSGTGTTSVATAVLAKLTAQQDAVLAAQTSASAALTTSTAALATQEQACAVPVATQPSADATSGEGDGEIGDSSVATLSQECSAALATVQSVQSATATAQSALQKSLEALGSTLTSALGDLDPGDPGDPGDPSDPGASAPGVTSGSGGSGSPAGAGRTITAATLAQDQAAIDRATAALASAKADLAAAVVRAPADGSVVSLTVAPGDTVGRGDTVATVVAPGLSSVTIQATAAQAAQLEQGMTVSVTPAGRTDALSGVVSRVEHVATPSADDSSAAPTYLVEIVLDDRDLGLPSGIPASVSIVVGSAKGVVVVPASAVVDGTVTVLEDGALRPTRVTTGILGDTEIEVVEGVDEGDQVVLADLDSELPTGGSSQVPGGLRIGGTGGGPPAGGSFQRR